MNIRIYEDIRRYLWVLGMPYCSEITQHFETFCGVTYTTSEQHVELRMSHQLRNNKDVDTLLQYLTVLDTCHQIRN